MQIKSVIVTLSTLLVVTNAKNQFVPKVEFNIRRGDSRDNLSPRDDSNPRLIKRDTPDGSAEMVINNQQTFYEAVLEIGSNKDKTGVLVDTGSSDLWVMSHDVDCRFSLNRRKRDSLPFFGDGTGVQFHDKTNRKRDEKIPSTKTLHEKVVGGVCTQLGSFDTEESETFKENTTIPYFYIEYADNTAALGVWGYDNVYVGGVRIDNLSFAVANTSSSDVGVLGIGLPGLETTTETYENLPLKMRNQGLIHKSLYSLYLNDYETQSGTILFGAIDHAKYQGNLETLPIKSTTGSSEPVRIIVDVDSIELEEGSDTTSILSSSTNVVLDSGSTLSYFYPSVLTELGSALNGRYSSSIGAYVVSCNFPSLAAINIQFGDKTIRVPVQDLVLKVSSSQCVLGVLAQRSSASYMLFGDNILRNAYVVFNLEDFEVSLAQVRYTDDEDIEVIKDTVPTTGGTTFPTSTDDLTSSTKRDDDESTSSRRVTKTSDDSETTSDDFESITTRRTSIVDTTTSGTSDAVSDGPDGNDGNNGGDDSNDGDGNSGGNSNGSSVVLSNIFYVATVCILVVLM